MVKDDYKDYEIIDHTADIGLKVYGKNKEELFLNAARGMFFLITDTQLTPVSNKNRKYYTVNNNASNIEDLLVAWLSELLFIHATEFVILDDYEIHSLTEQMIKSRVGAIKIKGSPYRVVREIKAITYHNLHIFQDKTGRWQANIVFDI